MVDLEKRVGLAAHRSVAEKCPDDDRVLLFRQTSHDVTHLTEPLGRLSGVGFAVISRYVADVSTDSPQMFEVPNPSVDVDSWEG